MSYAQRVADRRRAVFLRRARRVLLVALAAALMLIVEVSLISQLVSRNESAAVLAAQSPDDSGLTIPVPTIDQVEAEEPRCESSAAGDALTAKDPAALIEALGGAEQLREAVAAGAAPCVPLDDPVLPWVVVNKQRAIVPVDYAPQVQVPPSHVVEGGLRVDVVDAFERMVAAADEEGAGRVSLFSGYRSYATQVATYDAQVSARGESEADALSAHPGHSEHQLGLAVDVVACEAGGCGTIYQLGDTAQGQWLAENSWRFGWIIRYEDGQTETTGYDPEPWHLRYIGEELAAVYHEGGFRTLEEFFGLPAAPDYG
ncbi:M15 family metallopeptidase [Microbacterium marinilacus]|uniref:D-alanyl-D-alanine carboxypeptidase-like core domain-containing protein n=1 Tax=Microbacterium marinilacus TaxID=415209 RepID=A0ABP7BHP5_9MICO|nr:M15 family metallopeptidase [Microbacterium marinilacus]MBY0690171.1 M15 family metallopeptidase [Microbacterium marinilacus]